jgi:hypothetical protein
MPKVVASASNTHAVCAMIVSYSVVEADRGARVSR